MAPKRWSLFSSSSFSSSEPKSSPQLARGIGKSVGEFRKAREEFEDEIRKGGEELDVEEAKGKEARKDKSEDS